MNAGIHTASKGFQHLFKLRALLEQAPKALCRGLWEGSSCLEYLSQHRERGSFVSGSPRQGESLGEERSLLTLATKVCWEPCSGQPVPKREPCSSSSPVVPLHVVRDACLSGQASAYSPWP